MGLITAEGNNENKLLENMKKKAMSVGADGLVLRKAREFSQKYASERRTEFASYKIRWEALAIRLKK